MKNYILGSLAVSVVLVASVLTFACSDEKMVAVDASMMPDAMPSDAMPDAVSMPDSM